MRSFSGSALRASASGTARHSQDGTGSSSTFFRRAETPALRKYFWASTSEATCDQAVGTSTLSRRNTTDPSGFSISDVVNLKSIRAYGVSPCVVWRRSIRIVFLPRLNLDRAVFKNDHGLLLPYAKCPGCG